MSSSLLDKIGLGNIDPAYIIIGLLLVVIAAIIISIICLVKLSKLNDKYRRFMTGKDGKSLEDAVAKRFSQVDKLIEENKKKTVEIEDIFNNLKISVQKVGIVKYDAFNEMGGKLSFSLAMLNKENSGFIINAMHSREGCYTYIKEIINGESYIPLGTEEKEALEKAMEV
ncbi:MAG: DUF4446 family protein [Lachnospiraceae bacterium]